MTYNLEQLRYPVGTMTLPDAISEKQIDAWIQTIASFPAQVEAEVVGLTDRELQYRYRPEGWTIHQVVLHCVDSHTNSLIRFKWTLTENHPTIKTYNEAQWAELPDTIEYPIANGIALLHHLHARWVFLLRNLTTVDLERTYVHPEKGQTFTLKETIGHYAWHCRHHLQHIRNAKEYKF